MSVPVVAAFWAHSVAARPCRGPGRAPAPGWRMRRNRSWSRRSHAETHGMLQPIRRLHAWSVASGAWETSSRVTSRACRCGGRPSA